MGFPVFYADDEAKQITNTHPLVVQALTERYGQQVYVDGKLNRTFLAEKVFSNEKEATFVNQLIHPLVRDAYDSFADQHQGTLVFNEAAILFETGAYKTFDRMVLVTAPEEMRMERVMRRDNVNADAVKARMSKQWKDDRKKPLADFVINNDEHSPVIARIEQIVAELGHSISS